METAEKATRPGVRVDGRLGSLALEFTPESEIQQMDQDVETPDETIRIQYSHTATDTYPLMQKICF